MAVVRKQQQKTLTFVEKFGKMVAGLKRRPVVVNVAEVEKCQVMLDNTTDSVTRTFLTKRLGQLQNPGQAVSGAVKLSEQLLALLSDAESFPELNTVKVKVAKKVSA